MGLFDQFPYTNFHELNLDWILRALKELEHTIEQFVAINALKYANPIQWNITTQYEKNTIVIDPQSGTAYISVQPVPAGVALTNTDYWTVVFDLEQFVTKANNNFTVRVEGSTTLTATFPTNQGEWVVWNGTLYEAQTNIIAGDQYVVDSNIKRITIEEVKNLIYQTISQTIGSLSDLDTSDKSNVVNAINEVIVLIGNVITLIGALDDLNTTDKTSIVNAINEVIASIGNLSDLSTTDKSSIVNAINEVITIIGDLSDLSTTDKSSIVNALNEVLSTLNNKIGDLNDLDTSDKTSIVNAINETLGSIQTITALSVFNVKDYGAKGDNLTDDTVAIQNTINAASNAGGGIVYFPIGKYIVSGTLNVVTSYITLLGASQYGVQIIRNSDYGDTIHVEGTAQLTAIHIANMFLNHVLPTEMTGAHIKMINTAQCSIKNVYTENGYYGFECGGVVDLTIHNCILVGRNSSTAGHNGKYGIFLRAQDDAATPLSTQVKIYGTRIFGPRIAGFEAGICIEGAEEVEILNCYIGNNKSHNIMFYQRSHIILECTIMGCYLDACSSHSIYFNGNGGDGNLYVGNTKIIGNQLKGQSRDGFTGIFADDASRTGYFTYCTQGLTISGNTISGLSSHGIYLLGGNDITIVGNTVSGIGGYCCIIGDGVISATITGNIFGGASLANGAQDSTHGIAIEDQAREVNCFNNNVIHNATPMAITADAMGSHSNILSNNLGFLNQPSAAPAMPASGTELKNPYGTPCFVSVYGGTITNLQINNATLATGTPVMFELGPQDRVKISYSAAPSWVWFRHY